MKLKIFGVNVPIYKQKGLSESTDWCGYYDPLKRKIVIDADLSKEELEITILHETLEAMWERGSFGLAVNNDTKEIIIDQISKCLCENYTFKFKKV